MMENLSEITAKNYLRLKTRAGIAIPGRGGPFAGRRPRKDK